MTEDVIINSQTENTKKIMEDYKKKQKEEKERKEQEKLEELKRQEERKKELEARKTTIEDTFEKSFENFLPEDNLISVYTSIFKHSKYPPEFFFTTFMVGLLQLTYRKVKVLLEIATYPIIFLTLLADSSRGKSPPIVFYKKIFKGLINFLFGFNSTVGFISEVGKRNGQGTFIEEEYQRVFKSINLIDLPDKLNDLYFAGELRNKIKHEEESFEIPETYVNKIITLTPVLFSKYTDSDAKESGSIQRETFMFPIRFIKSDEEGIQHLDQNPLLSPLVNQLTFLKEGISQFAQQYANSFPEDDPRHVLHEIPFEFDKQTEIDLIKYEEDFLETNKYDKDMIAAGGKIKNKLTSYAMAFYLGDPEFLNTIQSQFEMHNLTFVIPRQYYDCALKFFKEYVLVYNLRAVQLINEKVHFNPTAEQYTKVYDFILQGGKEGVSSRQLSRKFQGLDIAKIRAGLIEQDRIYFETLTPKTKPVTYWYALKD